MPMNGIEPLFEAYESPVLPLNYTGQKIVGGAGLAPASGGYEPPEILLLHPPPRIYHSNTHQALIQGLKFRRN